MEGEATKADNTGRIVEPPITIPNPRYSQPTVAQVTVASVPGQSKYIQLLNVIEELGRDIRPTYAGSRSSAERIKRGIVHARILILKGLAMFRTLETFDTELSADSVEWCPIAEFRDHFVCGTYQLSSNDQKERVGRIYLLQVIPASKLHLLHQVDVPAVLDMKWAHVVCQDQILLGVVNAIGCLQVWKLERERKMKLVVETKLHHIENHECLALSLDWNTGRCSDSSMNEAKITISDSKGFISIYSISQGKLSLVGSQMAHQFEAWITAFNYWNTNIIYSGGDDCKFRWFDLRSGLEPVGSNAVHTAGVTSLHSNAGHEFSLASGSYDETLRLWDTRQIRQPVSEINLSGGIWRLKWDPFLHKNILAACMYGHFKIINYNYNNNLNIVGEFKEHESIAYGCDWSSLCEDDLTSKLSLQKRHCKTVLTATCSFYDHVLKLSTVELFD